MDGSVHQAADPAVRRRAGRNRPSPGRRADRDGLLLPVTAGGWLAVMLAAVLAAIAIRALNPWLLLIACALAAPVLLAQVLRPDLGAVSVAFRSPERMVVGEATRQRLTVRNEGSRTLPGLWVSHLCPGLVPVTLPVPPLAPGCRADLDFVRAATYRGHAHTHEIRLDTSAPFGMALHSRRILRKAWILVQPARVPPGEIATGRLSVEDTAGARPDRPGSEPHGLREWRHGDDHRQVNWRASARQASPDRLIVAIPEPEVESRLLLVVTGSAEDPDWEALVSLAAWSACAAAGTHIDVTLLAPGVPAWTGTDPDRILDWFSGLDGARTDHPPHPAVQVDGRAFEAEVLSRTVAGTVVVEASTRPFGLHRVNAATVLGGRDRR